jgi:hypothetical protein
MSWGSAAEGASEAGSGASAASSGAGGATITGQMADLGGQSSTPASSGFSLEATNNANSGVGPTVDAANTQTYGTTDPSIMQQTGNYLERFQKGQGNSMGGAVERFGNNPETYGYLYDKVGRLASAKSGGGGAAPITTNISYQQPQNDYLRRRRGY